jgi:hypothetical protein
MMIIALRKSALKEKAEADRKKFSMRSCVNDNKAIEGWRSSSVWYPTEMRVSNQRK